MGKDLSEKQLLEEINSNVKKLISVIAVQGLDDGKKIKILSNMGYSSFEIEEITGIPAATVRGKKNKK